MVDTSGSDSARLVRFIDADSCEFVHGSHHAEKTPEGTVGNLTPIGISAIFCGGITSS